MVLEKTLESPLDCKEIQPVNPKGNQSWIFIGRTYAEAETAIFWPPDAKNWLLEKDPDAGKDWRQEEGGQQRMRWLDGITTQWTWIWASSRSWQRTGKPWWAAVHGVVKSQTWLDDWTDWYILTELVSSRTWWSGKTQGEIWTKLQLYTSSFWSESSFPHLAILCVSYHNDELLSLNAVCGLILLLLDRIL